jgi:BioD-like phosphotransacetylase family protein
MLHSKEFPMQISLYVAGAGRGTGKSVVALGLMEMLSAFNRTIGFFRPIVQRSAQEDALIELMRARYNLLIRAGDALRLHRGRRQASAG